MRILEIIKMAILNNGKLFFIIPLAKNDHALLIKLFYQHCSIERISILERLAKRIYAKQWFEKIKCLADL